MATNDTCRLCGAALPLARSVIGKAVTAPLLGAFGIRNGSTLGEKLLYVGAGVAVGHAIDILIKEVAGDLCGHCKGKPQPV